MAINGFRFMRNAAVMSLNETVLGNDKAAGMAGVHHQHR